MSESSIFSKEVIDYILKNENADPYTLALKKSPFSDVNMKVICRQIQGRKIAKKKFPFLLKVDQYLYPKKESLEQASSEITALFKSKLISGESFVDLTGGMGIDTYLLGRNFPIRAYVEPNFDLYRSTTQNFLHLGYDQCETFNISCEEFLLENGKKYDWAYIDPSRRIDGNRKTSIYNYEPNLVDLQQQLSILADNLLVKLSPMQDISECIKELKHIHKIWVISIQNEVKELLLHLKQDADEFPIISAVDISKNKKLKFSYLFDERSCNVKLGRAKKYLYQPNASIIKSELQNRYASQIGLEKLNVNTHLYTSDEAIEDFMGRVFLVKDCIQLNKKEIKKALPLMKANVITKNFPLNAQELIKKYKLKEGGEEYLIAYTDVFNQKEVVICRRLK